MGALSAAARSTILGLAALGLVAGCGSATISGSPGRGGGGGPSGGGGSSPGVGGAAGGGVPGSGAFPQSSTFYQDISRATLDPESAQIIQGLTAFWTGSGNGGSSLGIDVSLVMYTADPSVPRRSFTNGGDDPDCDTAPVPLPPGGSVEGSNDYHCPGGDCHLLVYQGARLYEMYQADVTTGQPTGGTFSGSCLVVWDTTHDYWQPAAPPSFGRGDHCNGADAADMPMAPLILTADDVRSGEVKHAMRFTIPNAHIRADVYVHPATHIGGPTGGLDQPPYGARLRLRGDYDLTKLPSDQARAVARALQRYGMFLTDGGNLFITATIDVADVMSTAALRGLKATDFEVVDGGARIRWRDYQCTRTVVSN